ncbi:MAG: hypothetical protein ABI612_00500 [Betaproteobacteria bacterium]
MYKLTCKIATLALCAGISAAALAATSAEEYKASLLRTDADYRVAREKCDAMAGTTKSICVAESKAAEKRAKADAEATYKNTDRARYDARIAGAEADYMVAKERCQEKAGNARDVCVQEAKANLERAHADASVAASDAKTTPSAQAVQGGSEDRGPAVGEQQATRAQCENLTGNARDECLTEADAGEGRK